MHARKLFNQVLTQFPTFVNNNDNNNDGDGDGDGDSCFVCKRQNESETKTFLISHESANICTSVNVVSEVLWVL